MRSSEAKKGERGKGHGRFMKAQQRHNLGGYHEAPLDAAVGEATQKPLLSDD